MYHHSVDVIQTRWSIIKQRYVDELQKERNAHYANIPFHSTWEHFQSMEFMRDYLEKKVDEREMTREQICKIVNEKLEMENNYQLQQQRQRQENLAVEHNVQTANKGHDSVAGGHLFQQPEQLQIQLQQEQHMQDLLEQGVCIEEEIQTDQTQQHQHSELIDNEMHANEPIYLTRSKQQLQEPNLLIRSGGNEAIHIHTKDYYHPHYNSSQLEPHHASMVEVTIDESPMVLSTGDTILLPTDKAGISTVTSGASSTIPIGVIPLYRNQNTRVVPSGIGHQVRAVISRRHSHPEATTSTDDLEWNPFEMIMQVQTNGDNNDDVDVIEQEVDVSNNGGSITIVSEP